MGGQMFPVPHRAWGCNWPQVQNSLQVTFIQALSFLCTRDIAKVPAFLELNLWGHMKIIKHKKWSLTC